MLEYKVQDDMTRAFSNVLRRKNGAVANLFKANINDRISNFPFHPMSEFSLFIDLMMQYNFGL